MKKIIILISIFCVSLSCKSQIIPIEGIQEYLSANNIQRVPSGAYMKDVNGLFDGYIGEWQATYNNRIYTFYITEEVISYDNRQKDKLFIKYIITELDGTIVVDTREEEGNSVFGDKFTDDLEYYIFGFGVGSSECGNEGNMYITQVTSSPLNSVQIKIGISYGAGAVAYTEELCGDFVLENEPLYPLSITSLILTRQ